MHLLPALPSETEIRRYRLDGDITRPYWTNAQGDSPLPPPPSHVTQPPAELFVQARPESFELLSRLPEEGFAVVGTRRPQPRSLALVRERIGALRGSRLIILSGLARGIDAAAHEEAIRNGLPTIAVLGSALDDVYPREHRELAESILRAGGALISEFAPGTPIQRHFFLRRNRLIAAWAKATWVVEAGFRSGALNTAKWASDHGRDCYATPCFPGDSALAGNQRLLSSPMAHPFWNAQDLIQTWPELNPHFHPARGRQASLPLLPLLSDKDAPLSDAARLKNEVTVSTFSRGGLQVEELLDWALGVGWNPQRFFSALQAALNEGCFEDHNGILCSVERGAEGSRERL